MFANMKIGTRLGAGFAAVLLLLAIVAGVGIKGMHSIQERLDDIVEEVMHKEKLLGQMTASTDVVARAVRGMLLSHDPAGVGAERQHLDQAYQRYNDAIAAL